MPTTQDPARPLLTLPEVADRLRVSVKTVRRRIESGELPAVRLGTGSHAPVRVDAAELHEWLYGPSPAGSRSDGGSGRVLVAPGAPEEGEA